MGRVVPRVQHNNRWNPKPTSRPQPRGCEVIMSAAAAAAAVVVVVVAIVLLVVVIVVVVVVPAR